MDKFKEIQAQAKKHYFWVLFGLVVVITLACWYLFTSDLNSQFAKLVGKRKSDFDSTKKICEVIDHPNGDVIKDHTAKADRLGENVYKAWQTLYDEQKNKNSLPEGLKKNMSAAAFRQFKQQFESGAKIDLTLREYYQYFVTNHLPNLWKMIQCREYKVTKPAADAATRPVRGPAGFGVARGPAGEAKPPENAELVGIVDWDPADRERISERFRWPKACPTDLEVRLAQEDLWVYEALLRVIERVNESATAHHNAPIKRILSLEIGQNATDAFAKSRDTIVRADANPGTAAGEGAGGVQDRAGPGNFARGPQGPGGPGAPPAATGEADAQASTSGTVATAEELALLSNRYVDAEGKPLPVDAQKGEFKMMPVQMRMYVQQKMIPKLLVECANSSMPIEVRVIRLHAEDAAAGRTPGRAAPVGGPARGPARGPAGGPLGGPMRGPGAIGPAGGAAGGGGSADASANVNDTDITGLDVPVEIQGVIYIFSPPDKARFGLKAADEPNAEAEGDADATPADVSPKGSATGGATVPEGGASDPAGKVDEDAPATSADNAADDAAGDAEGVDTVPGKDAGKAASPAKDDAATDEGGA